MGKAKTRMPLKIAVVLPSYAGQANEMARGVARFVRASGRFQLRDAPFISHREIPERLARLAPNGAVMSLSAQDFEEIRGELPTKLALVNISTDRLAPGIGGVCSSDEAMVALMHHHLSEAGYHRFAMVGPTETPAFQRRLERLRQRVAGGTGVETFDLSHLSFDENSEPQSDRRLESWLRGLRPPVGIIVWLD